MSNTNIDIRELKKSLCRIGEDLRKSTCEANEALSKIRGSIGKVKEQDENDSSWQLARRISYFNREELFVRFSYYDLDKILRTMTPDQVRECLDKYEKSIQSKLIKREQDENDVVPKPKRGDIVDVVRLGPYNTHRTIRDCIFLKIEGCRYILLDSNNELINVPFVNTMLLSDKEEK